MNHLANTLLYLGFFGLIAFSVWWTKSANCLWALVLIETLPIIYHKIKKANK